MDEQQSRFDIPQEEQLARQKIRKQGILILGAIVMGIVVFMGGIVYLSLRSSDSTTSTDQANVSEPVPTVTLTTVYENPFNEEVEYTNPFTQYQNPFDELE